jgi:hypothetical protein
LVDRYNFAIVDGNLVSQAEQSILSRGGFKWYQGNTRWTPQFLLARADGSYVCTFASIFVNERETREFIDGLKSALERPGLRTSRVACR